MIRIELRLTEPESGQEVTEEVGVVFGQNPTDVREDPESRELIGMMLADFARNYADSDED